MYSSPMNERKSAMPVKPIVTRLPALFLSARNCFLSEIFNAMTEVYHEKHMNGQ